MKIQIDNIVRDMTSEEIEELKNWRANTHPVTGDEAGPEDYEQALEEMGVDFND